jgi:hypothetical protein
VHEEPVKAGAFLSVLDQVALEAPDDTSMLTRDRDRFLGQGLPRDALPGLTDRREKTLKTPLKTPTNRNNASAIAHI